MGDTLKIISPVDGRIYVERQLATSAGIGMRARLCATRAIRMELTTASDTLRDSRRRSQCLRGQGERARLRDHLADRVPYLPLAKRDPRL
jgi:hypothetical protein